MPATDVQPSEAPVPVSPPSTGVQPADTAPAVAIAPALPETATPAQAPASRQAAPAREDLEEIVNRAGLQWVETAPGSSAPEPVVEAVTPRPARKRPPRREVASEPLQQVETRQ
jgi:ribonuclease E